MDEKLKKISDIEDFSGLGFHFSDGEEKIQSILQKGLTPLIGDNSSTFEATPKVSFSLGIEGLFQMANRFLNLAQVMPLSFFITDTHKKYLPEKVDKNNMNYIMKTSEALEFMKNYFQNSSYFVFDAPVTQYENDITDEDIRKVNESVKAISIPNERVQDIMGMPLDMIELGKNDNINIDNPDEKKSDQQNLYELVKKIAECTEKYSSKGKTNLTQQELKEYEMLINAKNRCIISIMQQTRENLNLGELQQDGLYDRVAFHEHKLKWRDQSKRPLNVQTRVIISEEEAVGKGVPTDELSILSVDGQKRATVLEVLQELYARSKGKKVTLDEDYDLVEIMLEYIQIPNGQLSNYISEHEEFAQKIFDAQQHAYNVIQKQNEHDNKSKPTTALQENNFSPSEPSRTVESEDMERI